MDPRLGSQTTRQRPGHMTAVMRAVAPSAAGAAKVLRIGVVRAGRVVEERIVKQRTTVTVGASESATFVVAAANVPPGFALFERVGDDYHLNLLDGMKGRVALASGITDLKGVTGTKVLLTDDARGKVVIGDTTLLFQFVAPPPVQPRPQLPLAVKGSLAGNHDWTLTFVAAFSFLLHFGLVGSMYSDWADPVVDDGHQVAGLVDMMNKIPPPLVIEVPDQT
ncbi:MAG TPA: energy transducer TonB, partial [Labilithrix sp.]|nr:energy transducer TonB [Labilithrix sp.]